MAEPLSAQDARRIFRQYLINLYVQDPTWAAQAQKRPKRNFMGIPDFMGLAQDAAEADIARQYPNTAEGDIAVIGKVTSLIQNLDANIIPIAEVVPTATGILNETRDQIRALQSEAAATGVRAKAGFVTPAPTIGAPEEIAGLTPITPSPTGQPTTQTTLDIVKRMMEEPSYGLSLLLDATNDLTNAKTATDQLRATAKLESLGVIFKAAQTLQANKEKMLTASTAEQHYLDEQMRKDIEGIKTESRFGQTMDVTKRGQDITAQGQTLTAQSAAERLQLDTEKERQRIIEAQQSLQTEITKTLSERQRDAATVGANLAPFRLPAGTEYNPGFEPNSLMAQQAASVGLQYSPMRTSPLGVDPMAGVRTIQDYLARLGQTVQ